MRGSFVLSDCFCTHKENISSINHPGSLHKRLPLACPCDCCGSDPPAEWIPGVTAAAVQHGSPPDTQSQEEEPKAAAVLSPCPPPPSIKPCHQASGQWAVLCPLPPLTPSSPPPLHKTSHPLLLHSLLLCLLHNRSPHCLTGASLLSCRVTS